MTIETTDPQALDLLSAPRSPVVRLLRRISTPDTTAGSAGTKTLPGLEFESSSQEVTAAVWWSEHARDPRSPQRRVLHGEIHLSPGLKPTSRLGKFELSVSVTPPSLLYLLPTLHACLVLGRRLPSEGGRIPARWRRGGGAPERMRGHWHRLRRWAQAENPLPSWIR